MQDPVGSVKSQEKIFKVALPVSLEAVFQTSLGFVDQIIVGPSYPNVGKEVLHFTFWGLIIAAYVQPAKVLNSILGNGILPNEGDTKHPACHVIGSYAIGVPVAIFSSFVLHFSVLGRFRIKSSGESA